MADQPELDWSAAKVQEGKLSVKVAGETGDEWEQTFARTLALLSSGGTWGSVGFTKGKVTVEDVQEGSEDSVRFALDGAVQEANASHNADEEDADSDDASGEDDESEGDESEGDDADRRMTDRFRDPAD
jgi:hypothetical protein